MITRILPQRMERAQRRVGRGGRGAERAAFATGALVLILTLNPVEVRACIIDNMASLFADGVPAMRTAAFSNGPAPWAPFTIAQAIVTRRPVQLTEARSNLVHTLPATALLVSYRWTFGDGLTARGFAIVHRYAHAGLYTLTVSGYDTHGRHWFVFDRALLRVVPSDQALTANLGYGALRAVSTLSSVTWPIDAVLVLVASALVVRRTRTRVGIIGTC